MNKQTKQIKNESMSGCNPSVCQRFYAALQDIIKPSQRAVRAHTFSVQVHALLLLQDLIDCRGLWGVTGVTDVIICLFVYLFPS